MSELELKILENRNGNRLDASTVAEFQSIQERNRQQSQVIGELKKLNEELERELSQSEDQAHQFFDRLGSIKRINDLVIQVLRERGDTDPVVMELLKSIRNFTQEPRTSLTEAEFTGIDLSS